MSKKIMAFGEFMDIRNHDFVRLACVIPRVHLANPRKNVESHLDKLNEVYDKGTMYALCPELGLTGYSVGDVLLDETLLEASLEALLRLLEKTKYMRMIITVGLPLLTDNGVFNVAATIFRGSILSFLPKTYLPNYREFEEERTTSKARHLVSKEIKFKELILRKMKCISRLRKLHILDQSVLIGTDIMIHSEEIPEFILAGDICEDLWTVIPPSSIAALNGAIVLFNPSGSNVTMGKNEYRRRLMYKSGDEYSIRLYSSSGFGEAVSKVAWDNHGMIADRGTIVAETKRFNRHPQTIMRDVCLKACVFDRMRQGSYRDNAMDHRREYRHVYVKGMLGCGDSSVYKSIMMDIDHLPFVPKDPLTRDSRCQDVYYSQITSLVKKLDEIGGGDMGKGRLVVAMSGGVDSTQAVIACVKTMDELDLPRSHVIGITMPGFGTTNTTKTIALNLMKHLGITRKEIDIRPLAEMLFKVIGHNPKVENLIFQNAQALIRKLVQRMVAGQVGGLDINTSNLTESMVGWCTKFGDHAGDFGVNIGIPKTLESSFLLWEAEKIFSKEQKVKRDIIDCLGLPFSPELLSNREGVIVQISEQDIGPVELIDFYSYYFWRFGFKPIRIARMCFQAFQGKYKIKDIKHWLSVFLTRFFQNQHKRLCGPEGIKIGSVCVAQTGDMRLPSGIDPTIWLEDVARIPNRI